MRFICGNCNKLIREAAKSTRNFQGWQTHEACGYETEFANFNVVRGGSDIVPALQTRKVAKESKLADGKPSGADLDKDASEKKVAEDTKPANSAKK